VPNKQDDVTPYMLPGEQIEGSYSCKETYRKEVSGQLQLTNFKIIFRKTQSKIEDCLNYMVPYGYILKIQVYKSSAEMNDCYFVITCKDERVFKFRFH